MPLTEQEFQDHMRSLRGEPLENAGRATFPGLGIHQPMRFRPRRRVECADGFTMSVQGGWGKYSSPRDDIDGDYSMWECGFPSSAPVTPDLLEKAEDPEMPTETVYGYVPTETVIAEIEAHGGIAPQVEEAA